MMSLDKMGRRDVLAATAVTTIATTRSTASVIIPPNGGLRVIAKAPDLIWNGAVTSGGRLFASIPSWIGPTPGVVEVAADGSYKPYPDSDWNRWTGREDPRRCFVDINSIFADGHGHLWVVDAAGPGFGKGIPGAAKIVQIDLATNRIVRIILFDGQTMGEAERFGHLRVHGNHAILTESRTGAFVVVDLRDNSYRKLLSNHPLMRCAPEDVPVIEGKRLERDGKPVYIHNDLLEIAAGGETLYFCCLFGRRMFQVPIAALMDPSLTEAALVDQISVAFTFKRPWIAGMCRDADGNLFLTDAETNAVWRRTVDGDMQLLSRDEKLIWPIAPSIDGKGHLYVTATQLNRVALFAGGADRVRRPWLMFRLTYGD